MSYKETINNLEPVEFSRYKSLTSYEQYMAYTALVLEEKGVPLTFNYLCIAAFKLFPKKFCVDEEFSEFPSVDRLNRTMMHMKYKKGGQISYLAGSTREGYSFTSLGRQTAEMVKKIIRGPEANEISKHNKNDKVDVYKPGLAKYKKFLESDCFKTFLERGIVDDVSVYLFFEITPFTEIAYVRNTMESWLDDYAKDNPECTEFIKIFLSKLPK